MPRADLRGVSIAYEFAGEGDPLVLLNGVMMTMQSWVFIGRRLAREFRCLLHDFRGQLLSPRPPGPLEMDEHVEDLAALLDVVGIERAHIVGTSYGGEVGMKFALAHPERVRTLAVISSVSHVEPPLRETARRWIEVARTSPETLYDITAPDNFSPGFLSKELLDMGRARLAAYPPEFFENFADLCDAFLRLDVTARLGAIRCPTLVIVGEKDTLKPVSYSRVIAARIPGAELEVIPGAGHAVVIEQPDAASERLLRFIASRRSSPGP